MQPDLSDGGDDVLLPCALRKFVAPVVLTMGLLAVSEPNILAQDVAPLQPLVNLGAQNDRTPPYSPITLKQKYEYSVEQMFSGPHLLAILAHAGIDQAMVNPHAWGSDAPAYGVRAASLFGRSFVRATIGSGIRGLDHEDPRYFYSHKVNNWERTRYAIVHTFEVHNDNGSMMPAYSRFIGDFGMPFLAQTWHPGPIDGPKELRSGGVGLALGVGMNIAQEFWPDVKHALRLGPGAAALLTPGTVH